MMKINRTFNSTLLLVLFFLGLLFIFLSAPSRLSTLFSSFYNPQYNSSTMMISHSRDDLDMVLAETSMENKSLIITVVNKAYVDGERSMLDLFIDGLSIGEGTWGLVDHLLIVATDQVSYQRCKFLGRFHCYRLETEGVEFSGEKIYMSDDFIKMMWRRTLFLGDVLKRGYNFIFTDMDVLWFRNPFFILSSDEKMDFQISTDKFKGPKSNRINTGFYMIRSNNKTISLFNHWYAKKDDSIGMKEQDVLQILLKNGSFGDLRLNFRFLDTLYFSGFCQNSRDVGVVVTVHANCCCTISAKVADLTVVLHDWKRAKGLSANETSTFRWSKRVACKNSCKRIIKESN